MVVNNKLRAAKLNQDQDVKLPGWEQQLDTWSHELITLHICKQDFVLSSISTLFPLEKIAFNFKSAQYRYQTEAYYRSNTKHSVLLSTYSVLFSLLISMFILLSHCPQYKFIQCVINKEMPLVGWFHLNPISYFLVVVVVVCRNSGNAYDVSGTAVRPAWSSSSQSISTFTLLFMAELQQLIRSNKSLIVNNQQQDSRGRGNKAATSLSVC